SIFGRKFMSSVPERVDLVVIGAGPAGAIASALLRKKGYDVLVLEREFFPRFSIGESLLPQCMAYIAEAGMMEAVERHGFQFKNGAAFGWKDRYSFYDFQDKFSPGHGTTFQVERAEFDQVRANEASAQGVDIRYGHTTTALDVEGELARVDYRDSDGNTGSIECRFVLDASGFGRVVSR